MIDLNKYSKTFWVVSLIFLLTLCVSYSNHFDNEFHFDDTHTIVANEYIRDISNLPLFFLDIKYYGTMPTNRGYNPVLVALNAIDYWLAGTLDVRYFHASIFVSYLLLLVLMFRLTEKIFEKSFGASSPSLKMFALLSVGFFGLHASNAETINYIIMRSDSFSTLLIVLAFLLFENKKTRKYQLHLVAMLLAIGTKETGVMFGPILFIYAYLFEQEGNFLKLTDKAEWNKLWKGLLQALPAVLLGFIVFYLTRTQLIAPDNVMFAKGNTYGIYKYFITQWVVISHYLGNFILPLDLSADPDFALYPSMLNRKVLFGLALLLSLVAIAIYASSKKKWRPITFGIFWFFLALAPTSSFHPLGQVSNDHRTFFPYVGLVISLFWILFLLYERYAQFIAERPNIKAGLIAMAALIYGLHAYGTYQRNEVWDNEASLWYDVSVKSPNNGRGLMNYALTLMSEGKYEETLSYFERAKQLLPEYSYLHINMGILRNAMGFPEEAEEYFRSAIKLDPYNAEAYYYYAAWLNDQDRKDEARNALQRGNRVSPGHARIAKFLEILDQPQISREDRVKSLMGKLKENPSAEDYLNLSLAQYNLQLFKDCIESCQMALKLNPTYSEAYNNMCSAYIELNQPQKAIEACKKAIQLNPDFELAKNNLRWAMSLQSEK